MTSSTKVTERVNQNHFPILTAIVMMKVKNKSNNNYQHISFASVLMIAGFPINISMAIDTDY